MEISKEDIENVENALKINSDYKLKNAKFNIKSYMLIVQGIFLSLSISMSMM